MSVVETIAAQATPSGRGGVGILRISGPKVKELARSLLGKLPKVRYAQYGPFLGENSEILDFGIGLYFEGPNSFTGEDVLELQGHGGPVVMDVLLQYILSQGVRMARPGEFSERAFLNDKLDLAQAEAVADLIDASSTQAARSALRSLQGEFSKQVHALVDQVIYLRTYVEAAIDFPEEEVDFLSDGVVEEKLGEIRAQLELIRSQARQGALLREGMTVVLAGRPNAGKSSLLNALTGKESAIVTEIAGTTRDLLREYIHIDGMPLHIIDTAGLRQTEDVVERHGVERALNEIRQADQLLLLVDVNDNQKTTLADVWPSQLDILPEGLEVTVIRNKIDAKARLEPELFQADGVTWINLSAKTGAGTELLRQHLKSVMGFNSQAEGRFSARRRHLDALARAEQELNKACEQFLVLNAGELLAEDLRGVQGHLSAITGEFSSDDLLGQIFSSFCIGK
ncbi:tRNA uridine-5-carboxymethylaminomethyl(34) synthesis GTPase MnmE [Piscirickettsia litoralis]|uniref:tRNA modification GTPase MnmE n=1 Tax=Piscirickettsia litoralis TaxID=1891921 RepID=A0ABX3A322_9GAMM|nr:tRNA uridine-5-carboxymethylaminomethyl(34) synthesis GTPase MnmE [Piscirickettsia litoralis]ODN43044.1 tRNA uridine-5-carboxymethylaminomethyl(34) synthesis GTPase MnmE [Piscirickettsia litoralis]